MRDIKFKAWDKQQKKMFQLNGFALEGSTSIRLWYRCENNLIYNFSSSLVDIELMQYTGLKDKNGKEIYEGDIVQPYTRHVGKNDKKYYSLLPVIYEESWGSFVLEDRSMKQLYHLNEFPALEVVGNVYEKPELLKECEKDE